MPWTAKDADRHVKGLSPRQKRIWSRVANSMLAQCTAKGGSQKMCEGRAVRAANAVAQRGGKPKANLLLVNTTLTDAPRTQRYHGQDYLVCPSTLLVAGVLNEGYVTHESLVPQDWQGVPVVLNHPCDAEGIPCSARSPEVLEQCGMGSVFHARLGQGKRGLRPVPTLVGELWLNKTSAYHCGSAAVHALRQLERGEPMEVSTAFYSQGFVENGTFEGQPYREVFTYLRPDHLALLPHATGACSLQDGCGVFQINAQTLTYESLSPCACADPTACHCHEGDVPMTLTEAPARGWHGFVQLLKRFVEHEAVEPAPPDEDTPTRRIGEDDDEAFEDEENDEHDDDEPDDDDDDAVAAADTGQEAPAASAPQDALPHEPDGQENVPMPTTAAIKKLVDALIANERTDWEELDRSRLEALDEAMLMKMNRELKPPVVNGARSLVAVLEDVEPVEREAVEEAIKTYQQRKDKLIELIIGNGQNPFTRDELEGMKAERLEKLVRMSGDIVPGENPQKGANYSGKRLPQIRVVTEDEDIPEPPRTMELAVQWRKDHGLM